MPENTPMKVDASAFMPVLIQIVTKLLAMAGAFLVAHGLMTEDQVNAVLPGAVEQVVGVVLALVAMAWAAYRSKRSNDQKLAIVTSPETFVPPSVAVGKRPPGAITPDSPKGPPSPSAQNPNASNWRMSSNENGS